jgi:hypothetical protein
VEALVELVFHSWRWTYLPEKILDQQWTVQEEVEGMEQPVESSALMEPEGTEQPVESSALMEVEGMEQLVESSALMEVEGMEQPIESSALMEVEGMEPVEGSGLVGEWELGV